MSVVPERTGIRDLGFSGWVRDHLPGGDTGFLVSDLDFILYNYKSKRYMILEVKTRGGGIKDWQHKMFTYIEKWLKQGADADWTFHGYKLLQLAGSDPSEGMKLNGKPITEPELIKYLSMEW